MTRDKSGPPMPRERGSERTRGKRCETRNRWAVGIGLRAAGKSIVGSGPFVGSTRRATVSVPLVMIGLLIVTLGLVLRLQFLNYPMRYDESFNYMTFGTRTPWYIVSHYVSLNNHILHTLAMRVSAFLFGNAPAALRLPALVAGLMVIPASGWLAWVLFGHRHTVAATMLSVACSSYLIEYSCNARGYSLQTLMFTLATVCTVYLFKSPRGRWLWLAWGGLCALGMWANPTMVLGAGGLGIGLVIRLLWLPRGDTRRREGAIGLATCVGLVLILYAPMLIVTGPSEMYHLVSQGSPILSEFLDQQGGIFHATWEAWMRHAPIAWQVLLVAGTAGFACAVWRERSPMLLLLAFMLPLLPTLVWACELAIPPRVWTFALPLALACATYGLFQWSDRLPGMRLKTRGGYGMLALLSLAALGCAVSVSKQSYLSAWEHELVDVERILDDCSEFGVTRCALLVRYTPATSYYRRRKRITPTLPADADGVERVYIVSDTLKSVDDLWNENVSGFDRFSEPVLSKRLSRSAVFIAYAKEGRHAQNRPAPPGSLVSTHEPYTLGSLQQFGERHHDGTTGKTP